MPRAIIEITRTATTPGTGDYMTLKGIFDLHLPSALNALQQIVLEGYSISGIYNTAGVPAQSYLAVHFVDHTYNHSVAVAAKKGDERQEEGLALPVVSVPYTHHSYDQPATRILYMNDGGKKFTSFKIDVRGPNNDVPYFNKLTLFVRYAVSDAPTRVPRKMITSNVDSELPPSDAPILGLQQGPYDS